VGIVPILIWTAFLWLGVAQSAVIACADLRGFPFAREVLFDVAIPAAMLAFSLGSVAIPTSAPRSARKIVWLPFATLALVLVYYAFVSGISIPPRALGYCQR
jgi:hypothetical protein